MISFALFGAGRIGQIHAPNIARHPEARLAAIYDVDARAAEALAARSGAEVRSAEAIFASADVDAVLIGTPAETHAGLVETAARAGKAIFCEKPIDKDLGRTRECLKVVEEHGVPLFLAFQRRFDPSFAALKKRLAAGEIGQPEMVFLTSRDPLVPPLSYIARSGGLFRDMMIHDFDVARWLLGEQPETVYAVGKAFTDPAIAELGYVDTAVVTMTCASGAMANINCAMRATYGYDQRVEVHGSGGKLEIGNRFETSVFKSDGQGTIHELPLYYFTERYAPAYLNELNYFIECLQKGEKPRPDGSDGMAALMLAEAAHRSYRTSAPVRVAEVAASA